MEKKTIGSFLAALRKANGMTQKDLADQLNVSDKTVSRWERDDGTPDLSVIPVLAEIFDVTCDELLRGERKPPEERVDIPEENRTTQKGEKQRRQLLKSTLSQYQTQSFIAMGISVVGLLVALICNLAFLKAVLGFLCGAIFLLISFVCQTIFLNRALHSVDDTILEESDLSAFRRQVIFLTEKSYCVILGLLGFTFPLMLVDAYLGLTWNATLRLGAAYAALFLLVYAIVLYFLNAALVKKKIFSLSEKEEQIYWRNHKLKRTCALILALVLALTVLCHNLATAYFGPWNLMEGTTFQDYESFRSFMAQEVTPAAPSELIYIDDQGNEISEEDALRRTLLDKNGNVVCEYIERNQNVYTIRYEPQDGTVLPITVCTYDDLREAEGKLNTRNHIFGVVYVLEASAVLLFYFRKRAK